MMQLTAISQAIYCTQANMNSSIGKRWEQAERLEELGSQLHDLAPYLKTNQWTTCDFCTMREGNNGARVEWTRKLGADVGTCNTCGHVYVDVDWEDEQ